MVDIFGTMKNGKYGKKYCSRISSSLSSTPPSLQGTSIKYAKTLKMFRIQCDAVASEEEEMRTATNYKLTINKQ